MGRHAGWIAMYAGMAGGAAEILIPEEPFDIDGVAAKIKQRHSKGRYASIVVVAEGALAKEGTLSVASDKVDAFGHAQLGGSFVQSERLRRLRQSGGRSRARRRSTGFWS